MKNSVNIIERAKNSLFFLQINDLSFNIDDKIIFSNLSFNVSFSNIVLIKGRVGSGKTTLLKLIAGIFGDYTKNISIKNRDSEELKSIFIHSRPEFNFVTGYIKDEIDFCGLDEKDFEKYLDKSVYELSGGELKKISIIMALSYSDKLILLDEPLDMLDDYQSEIVSKFIIEKSKNAPFIIATHDNHFDDFADVIVELNYL